MSKTRIVLLPLAIVCGAALAACNVFARQTPTQFVIPSPDFTLTAIFSVLNTATATPPSVQTATQNIPAEPSPTCYCPTPTQLPLQPPTFTPLPTSTATFPPPPTSTPKPPKPTATKSPTPTFTPIPTTRPGPAVAATFFSTAPVIDGNLGEWTFKKYKVEEIVYGADRWFSTNDLSGTVMLGWDDNYLYLAAQVKDQKYVQNASGKDLYMGDSLEVLLDAKLNGDYYSNSLSADDYQVGISPGFPSVGTATEAFLWYPSSKDGKLTNVHIASQATADGYTIEVAIPWSVFEITPENGKQYGFAFSISDNDKDGSKQQETMVSNTSTRILTNPTSWGVVKLRLP